VNHCYQGTTGRRFGLGLATAVVSWALGASLAQGQTPYHVISMPAPSVSAEAAPKSMAPAETAAKIGTPTVATPVPEIQEELAPITELPAVTAPVAEVSAETAPKAESAGTDQAKTAERTEDPAPAQPSADLQVKQAQCCGSSLSSGGGSGGWGCGCCNHCTPGHEQCGWGDYDTCCGRILSALYCCICCPDPCYEPRWVLEANAAFFQDGARPVTQTRFRWDAAFSYSFPETAEYFWAEKGVKGPGLTERKINYQVLSFYQEIAAKGFSFFVEMPYLGVGPDVNVRHSGFGDVNLGTKSMFLDCELIQMTFQFRTFIPSGSAGNGLGTGHVSLEPSLLTTIKLASRTYLQTQFSEWIPVGGDSGFEGDVFEYHFSVNQALWCPNPGTALVGTLELNGLVFQDGEFTDALGLAVSASGHSYAQFGPGLRFALCDRCDIGVGAGFGLSDHGPAEIYRTEFRLRY